MKDWTDGPVRVLVGDVRECLADLDAESVQCVVTSPPYWGLRDYGVPASVWGGDEAREHEWGAEVVVGDPSRGNEGSTLTGSTRTQESANRWRATSAFCGRCGAWRGALGLEPTPDMYVVHLVEVFREIRRVLRMDGTCWLNLGDTYSQRQHGRSQANGSSDGVTGRGPRGNPVRLMPPGLGEKQLVGIPWRVALALQQDGWWLRADVIWAKPNPMPESVTDRPTTAHEHVFLLAKSERYFYDANAVREPSVYGVPNSPESIKSPHGQGFTRRARANNGVTVRQYADGTDARLNDHRGITAPWENAGQGRNLRSVWTIATQPYPEAHFATFPEELARRCIAAGTREGGVVLDPFAGSGTTLAVARRMGRRAVGIELQPDYLPLIQRRVLGAALPLIEMAEVT